MPLVWRRCPALVVRLCSALLPLWLGVAAAQAPPADRPTYAVGDRGGRGHGTYARVRIEKTLYVFAARGWRREVPLPRALAIARVMMTRSSGLPFDPPLGFRWPLEAGAK